MRPSVWMAVAVFWIAGMLVFPAGAATYYLSPTGDDAHPGVREQPWQTLEKANDALEPGDTAVLLDGEYPGVIEPGQSGDEGAPITYRADTPQGAVLTGGASSDGFALCVRLKDRQHVVLDGLYLLPRTGAWMRLTRARHCIVRNCRMEDSDNYHPVYCEDSHYNRFEDLECRRANFIGRDGHVLGDMWNNMNSSRNVFERIHISKAGHRPFGIYYDSPYNVVRACVFDCRWGRNFEFFSAPRLLVEDCVVTNGFNGSGSADGRSKLFIIDSIFRRNVVYRNYYGALTFHAYKYGDLPVWEMLRSRLYHNTFYRNHQFALEMRDYGENPDPHRAAGNVVKNNIFAFNDPGGDGLALLLHANIADDNRFAYNAFWGQQEGNKTIRYDDTRPGTTSWPGLAMTGAEANETKTAQFTGNIDTDPAFLDADADNFLLRPDSPCIDAGAPLTTARQDGSGNRLPVEDARWFFDGWGIPGEEGDRIVVGSEKREARVIEADIEANLLTLDRHIEWRAGDGVSLPYVGNAPDMGAYEHGASGEAWYAAPRIPAGLRVTTMETANETVVAIDFEEDNREEWHYYWNLKRQRNTNARLDTETAASGEQSLCIFATGGDATLSCNIRPRWWDIDRFPWIRFSYRIPEGVPVGLWLHAFESRETGAGAVCVGGTAARNIGGYPHVARHELVDDGEWHDITLDARTVREVFPDVTLLHMFRFYTHRNGKEGQQFWFDDFRILPEEEGP